MKHPVLQACRALSSLAAAVFLGLPLGLAGLAPAAHAQTARSPLLLVDNDRQPQVVVSWTKSDGARVEYTRDFNYTDDAFRENIGDNVDAFVAVGGSRLDKGAGHPRGAVVRVGFWKNDPNLPFFEDLLPGTSIAIELRGVTFNQPAAPDPRSPVQHVKYVIGTLFECALPTNAREQFNLYSVNDTLNGTIKEGFDARPGSLDGSDPGDGHVALTREDDTTITMQAEFPYGLLRHIRDPWKLDLPGTFYEPAHFHIEFEALPEQIAEEQGLLEENVPDRERRD